ncbi:hypothetical protein LTR36_002916 [Oleoguttula mirabilis]|uniref:LisH domain-containing protein n=1 Tax=Oleoguttula mirabilis TaxID=1507867 RepID=A0AAV9JKQ2_9PEZI|nr:hypothetical protein LTR36_002916 [Oleoguttula mirabilis]
MPATDSPALVVARFLKTNNYTESYEAFIAEAGLPYDAGTVSKGDLTLEVLLEEKKTFDLSAQFERLGAEDGVGGWTVPAPTAARAVTALPSSSNILSAAVAATTTGGDAASTPTLLATTADRRLHVLDATSQALRASLAGLHDSPILSCAVFRQQYLLTASMSGQLAVSDIAGSTTEQRRDHSKYIVKVAVHDEEDGPLIATAGWDCKINLYSPSIAEEQFSLGEPTASITLPTKPEAIVFLRHPETAQPILIVSRTDSSFLYYYTTEPKPRLLGRQNLAPHSNAWVAFTPSALALCPTDHSLLAVGTSTVPHMKLLLVRLLVPPYAQEAPSTSAAPATPLRTLLLDDGPATETQASQARAALVIAERESAAIQIHCTTMAPQTAYSTPAVAWRPDGSGVWVNGDDGAIRGVEVSSGKVVSTLQGHEAGSKVRCLWAGDVDGEDGKEEMLVSGGFDQKLIVWRAVPPS